MDKKINSGSKDSKDNNVKKDSLDNLIVSTKPDSILTDEMIFDLGNALLEDADRFITLFIATEQKIQEQLDPGNEIKLGLRIKKAKAKINSNEIKRLRSKYALESDPSKKLLLAYKIDDYCAKLEQDSRKELEALESKLHKEEIILGLSIE